MPGRGSSRSRGARSRSTSRRAHGRRRDDPDGRPRRASSSAVKELTGGAFCDRVIEAVGKQWPLDLAAELTRERGRLIVAGYHQDGPRQVNMQLWNWRGLDVINAHERDPEVYMRGHPRGRGRRRLRPPRPAPALHACLPAGPARRGARRHPRPAGRLPQSAGDLWPDAARARASASSASAGSAATAWRPSSRPAPSRSRRSPTPRRRWRPRRRRLAPGARLVSTLDELLDLGLDGVVIATPSALHAAQSIRALERGAAVFCQKPLGRTAAEARAVVDAARAADRLLGVDLSYRFTEGMRRIREIVRAGGARARLRGRSRLPQRLRAGQAVVLRPGARRAAAA